MALQDGPTQVELNGLNLINLLGTGAEIRVEEVTGWDGPTQSAFSIKQRARRSGATASPSYGGARHVVVSGTIWVPDPALLVAAMDRFVSALPRDPGVLRITQWGETRWVPARVEDVPTVTRKSREHAVWSIQLVSTDWRKFGTDVSDRTRLPSTSGGLVINATTYAWTAAAGASPSVMSYGGVEQRRNLAYWPRGTGGALYGSGTLTTGVSTAGRDGAATTAARVSFSSGAANVGLLPSGGNTVVPAGATASASAWVYVESGSALGSMAFALPGLVAASGVSVPVGVWTKVTGTVTNSGSTDRSIGVRNGSAPSAAGSMLITEIMIELATSVGDYFDGDFPAAGGLVIAPARVTAWGGPANASLSLYWAGGVLQRTNYATNPHGAGGVPLWAPSGYGTGGAGATSVVASGAPDGGSYSQMRWSTAASAGGASLNHPDFTVPASSSSRSVTVSAYVMSNQASAFSLATQVGSTSTTGGDVTGIPTGQWARLSRTITVPASSTPTVIKLGVRISNLAGTTAGLILAGTMALAEEGTVLGDYFDGNTANVGGLTIDAVTVTGQVSLTNPGNDTGPLRLRVDGPCTGPVVTHVGTGDRLVFSSSLVLAAGEWLDIDMEKHQVYANGQSSRAGYITARGWFGFDPGPNTFAFTAAQYDAASQLTVAGTPAWR